MICAPQPFASLTFVNAAVVIAFTVEYLIRLLLSGCVPSRLAGVISLKWDEEEMASAAREDREVQKDPPPYSFYYQMALYGIKFYSIIDLISIIPYYVSYVYPVSSLVFFRIFRLTRVVTLLKVPATEKYTSLLENSIRLSSPFLIPLSFYVSLLMVFFGCLVYIAERGTFVVSEMYPKGAYVRSDISGETTEGSPFQSIPDALYFVVITATTVGFGDLYPTTEVGRFLACFIVYAGILITAFPIAIIGQNFVSEYTKMIEKNDIKDEEERAALLSDFNNIPEDIRSEKIILEANLLLKILLNDTTHLSRHATVLERESSFFLKFSRILKRVSSPPYEWENEIE